MTELNAHEWNDFLRQYPEAHALQTAAWGELKSDFGWDAVRLRADDVGAQILFRRLPLGFTLAYIPKGPIGAGWEKLWPQVDQLCRKRKAIFLKVEPDLWTGEADALGVENPPPGFRLSPHDVQPPRTLLVDLLPSEEEILARMKQKTRYNIRLGIKKGVVVHPNDDVDAFFHLMGLTGERAEFGVHSLEYYRRAYELFHPQGLCEILQAEYQGEPLAALMVFTRGQRAWYLYGASSNRHRNLMPTYLLQWEAMRWAKGRGCAEYDLWGVPDADADELEANFMQRSDGLWGVYRFKRGFGGELQRSAGPWDRVYRPWFYALYRVWMMR
ncbi:MAG: peptidoglycan bridge formation glycyltransferase FemA/FemB family protein [Chloroflexi bacterium]|jgi:peptidoglycan pentaglycine glycine transferase (the first glycine)|nr:peptidoglycan bridge formation glycyltransferase FemA/FemB family protein [Chloroflexota bacterium]